MELVAAKDPRAQQIFALRVLPRVRRATRALLSSPADADDATQLCMIELLRAAPGFRGEGAIEAWSDRITARTTMRLARERGRRSSRIDGEAEAEGLIDPESRSPPPLASESLPRDLREYLAALTARREALILHHVLDHSIPEVAELTGVSPNTVKDRLLAAREALRRLIRRDSLISPSRPRRSA
ncbi:MAG: RNA polymerase sigma factor [Nannocystis sp.]|nr:RNA polymerase sigma factor [Nannocystis sp.]